jgi:hypothetical protein
MKDEEEETGKEVKRKNWRRGKEVVVKGDGKERGEGEKDKEE